MGIEGSKIGNYVVDRESPLGKGAFGEVYKGKHEKKGTVVAIKRCIIHSDMHGSLALKEIKNFQRIPVHKHIVQMIDYEYFDKSFWIVMEFCGRGDLEGYMKRYSPNLDRQIKIMYQCASAVSHMHNQDDPIVHRDIKPANILFKKEGSKELVKMADFGLTKVVELDDGPSAQLTSQVGTRAFMAPELYAGSKYDESVDTFALGLVFLAMLNYTPTQEYMFPLSVTAEEKGELSCIGQEMIEAKLSGTKPPVIVKIKPLDNEKMKGLKKLIVKMTEYEMKNRIKMADVVKELQQIGGSLSPSGMVEGSPQQHLLSNLSLAKTKMSPMMTSTYGTAATSREPKFPSTVVEDDEDKDEDEDEEEDVNQGADIGYILMRRMLEDQLRKKKEVEIKEKSRREAAERAADMLPLLALLKLVDSDQESGDKFEVGDTVCVDDDMAKAKDLQQDHGGWAKGMQKYLNEEGRVKEIKGDIVNVQFPDGQCLRFNALLLSKRGPSTDKKKPSGGKLVKGKFKMLDIVRIKVDESTLSKLQSGHGGWNKRMKNALPIRGVVHRVFDDGDVYVEFLNGDKWCLNADALELVDTSGIEIEAGDIVIVYDDRDQVMKLQKGHGDWVETMAKCLGSSGIVRKVGINENLKKVAVVEIDDSTWAWNVKALKLVAKGEEMVLIMLKKQLTGE